MHEWTVSHNLPIMHSFYTLCAKNALKLRIDKDVEKAGIVP
jgi:hypothetical protein